MKEHKNPGFAVFVFRFLFC